MIRVKLTQGACRGTCWWNININCVSYNLLHFYKKLKVLLKKHKLLKSLFYFSRFLYFNTNNRVTAYFLRKNNTFIKSKYSRTRQWSKSIVYFGYCMNILGIFLLFMYCYRLIFIWSYLWWLGFVFLTFFVFKNFNLNKKYFYYFI